MRRRRQLPLSRPSLRFDAAAVGLGLVRSRSPAGRMECARCRYRRGLASRRFGAGRNSPRSAPARRRGQAAGPAGTTSCRSAASTVPAAGGRTACRCGRLGADSPERVRSCAAKPVRIRRCPATVIRPIRPVSQVARPRSRSRRLRGKAGAAASPTGDGSPPFRLDAEGRFAFGATADRRPRGPGREPTGNQLRSTGTTRRFGLQRPALPGAPAAARTGPRRPVRAGGLVLDRPWRTVGWAATRATRLPPSRPVRGLRRAPPCGMLPKMILSIN